MATHVSDVSGRRDPGGSPEQLAVIAQRAQAFTQASGTAIALSEGNADDIICRASAGSSAPEVGTALRVEGTFTGLCIQSGKELRCDDAETDTRVDQTASRALGIRSMVAIPIKEKERVVGVLAAFAPTARAFSVTHVAVLKTMAVEVAVYLQRRQRDEAHGPEPLPGPAAKGMAVSAAASPAASAAVLKPAADTSASRQLPAVPKVVPVRAGTFTEEIDQSPQTAPVLRGLGWLNSAPLTKNIETSTQDAKESKTGFWPAFRTLDAVAAPGKRAIANALMIGAAAVVVALGIGFSLRLRKPAAPTQPSLEASSSSAAPAALAPASANAQPTAKNIPPAKPAPYQEETPSDETVVLSTRPSRISGARDNYAPSSDVPAIALGSGSGSGSLANLASPVSQPPHPRLLTQSDLEPVMVIKKVPPIYPIVAKQRRLSGSVVVQGTVDKNGRIKDLKLISGPPLFRDAAFEALKQWVFMPARLNGQSIEQPTKIRLDFGAQ